MRARRERRRNRLASSQGDRSRVTTRTEHPRTVVVGGGVIGVCCAYFLTKRGTAVTVLERDEIGRAASYGNAGTIAPGHLPINKPGRVKQALRSLLDPVSPLYLAPRWDPALAQWLWAFIKHCTPAHLGYALNAMAPLGHATSELFDQIIEEEDLDCHYRRQGYYEVFVSDSAVDSSAREANLVRQHGFQAEILPGDAVREREPALNDRIRGGVFYPEAATLNPYRFVCQLAERARQLGAAIRTHTRVVEVLTARGTVTGVRIDNGETVPCDAVVLATGAYSLDLVQQLGCRLRLQAAKGYHRDRDVRGGKVPALRNTWMLGEASVFCTPMDGFVRFAGTLEFSGLNHEIRGERLEQLTRAARRYLAGVADDRPLSEWCGLRPCTSDGLPVVGSLPGCDGAFIATGHAMLGLTLGPITGKLITEYVLDGKPSFDTHALRPGRF